MQKLVGDLGNRSVMSCTSEGSHHFVVGPLWHMGKILKWTWLLVLYAGSVLALMCKSFL